MRTTSSQPHLHQQTSRDSVLLSWSHCPRLRISGESFEIITCAYKLTTTLTPTQTSRDSVVLSWSHCPRLRISGESFEIITCTLQAHNHTYTNKPQETQCCFHGLIACGSESAGKALRSSHAHYKLTTTLTPTNLKRLSVAFMVSLPAAQNQRGKL